MIVFLCIDYTIWPGWNHRGVYLYSREQEFKVEKKKIYFWFVSDECNLYFPFSLIFSHLWLYPKWFHCQDKIPRKLSDKAHRRMKMVFDRRVNTTICDPEEWLPWARPRWHPHKAINPALIRWLALGTEQTQDNPSLNECFRAPVHPYISRDHRRNLKVLD